MTLREKPRLLSSATRVLCAGAIAVLSCVSAGAVDGAGIREFEATGVPMQARKVAAHTYYVEGHAGVVSTASEGFNSNAGFVVTSQGVVLFDALGTPALGKRLREIVRATTSQPVRRIVVSHYHSDHFYGLQAFVRPVLQGLQGCPALGY